MKSRSQKLAEHSINSALSAIEIYNKPDFKDREQIFAVLIVIAWEALLKAKVLKDNSNRVQCLYVKDGFRYKRNRNNQHFTIDVYEATRKCGLDSVVAANIERLVEIRDAVVHMRAESPTLPYLVFTLGTATLQNYVKLLKQWFGISLARYHFYILPLAFDTPFRTLRVADLKKEPAEIRDVIAAVSLNQQNLPASDFDFICEIETNLVSVKKITNKTDLVASIAAGDIDAKVVQRTISALDKYPLSANELNDKVRAAANVTQNRVWRAIKELGMKGDTRYSKYSYRTHKDEEAGPSRAYGSIYNEDAVKLLVEHFRK
jgi:hypothetical protein